MREIFNSTASARDQEKMLPRPIGPPVMRAACFSALLYVGWMLFAGWLHPSPQWLAGGEGSSGNLLLYYLCLDGFALALSAGFLTGLDDQRFRALGLSFFPRWWRHAAIGATVGAAAISLVAFSVAHWREPNLLGAIPDSGRLPALAAFFLLAATFEELMFRGYAWQRLAESLGAVSATLISSALFGLAHAANPRATSLSIFNTMLAGVLMCIARSRTRALWMPLGLHFGWNLFLGAVFQYPVSGYQISSRSSSISALAPDWLTGGPYGLEGSAVLTVVAVGAILLLAKCPRNLLSPFVFQE